MTGFVPFEETGEPAIEVRLPVKSSTLKPAIWLYCCPRTQTYPMVPPPQAVMPNPNATDANRAIAKRPYKLNFMRFLHHPSRRLIRAFEIRGNRLGEEY